MVADIYCHSHEAIATVNFIQSAYLMARQRAGIYRKPWAIWRILMK
jgi:hypothetical protein